MMGNWMIRQDCPNGGVLNFVGRHAFQAQWALSADPPSEESVTAGAIPRAARAGGTPRFWFRTGADDDDIFVQFFNLRWLDVPPKPARARRLMAQAVGLIDKDVGERF